MTTPVLICDDSSVARKQMAKSLPKDWDCDISYAANGQEALVAIREGKGDVLFLDLNMPVMDGYETLEAIAKEDLPTMVIVVSGDIQPEAHNRVKKLGAIGFIKKPIKDNELEELLTSFGIWTPGKAPLPAEEPVTAQAGPKLTRIPGIPVADSEVPSSRFQGAGQIEHRDCIQEISNVAMGQAADLLARLLDVFVKLPIPNVNLLEVSELEMALSLTQSQTYSAACQGFIASGIAGEALLIFSDSSFSEMARLLKYEGQLDETIELELIMDMTSILVGACIKGIAEQLDLTFSQGHPMVLGQHVKVTDLIKSNARRWRKTLAIEITYEIENYDITCDLLLLITEDSIDNLYKRLSYLM